MEIRDPRLVFYAFFRYKYLKTLINKPLNLRRIGPTRYRGIPGGTTEAMFNKRGTKILLRGSVLAIILLIAVISVLKKANAGATCDPALQAATCYYAGF